MGLDVSHNNGSVDFAKVKAAGNSFVWIKATQGNSFVDPMFDRNWQAAADAGLLRGAYHFMQNGSGGLSQADHLLQTVHAAGGLLPTDLGYCLDFEDRAGISRFGILPSVAEGNAFLQRVQAIGKRHPVIYLDRSMGSQEVQNAFGQWHLWLADYSGSASPTVPHQWSDWAFWQYDQYGTVDGVPGVRSVDLDRFRFGLSGLAAWAAGTIVTP